MDGPYKERWQKLCNLVAEEKDPVRFSQLIAELLEELHKKEGRLKHPVDVSAKQEKPAG
jgi:hypothetical protein